jgi:large conductance mechanosensitive channel
MGLFKEFKEFAMRGNVMDLAIGIIIGAAFGTIITSAVNDLLMPPIGLATGRVDFSQKRFVIKPVEHWDVAENKPEIDPQTQKPFDIKIDAGTGAPVGEVAIRWGRFVNAVINFVIVAFCVFMVVKVMNMMHRKQEAAPTPPAEMTKSEVLLTEIRDLMKEKK